MGDQSDPLERLANGPAADGGFVLDRQCGQGLCPGPYSKALYDFGSERSGQETDRENGPCGGAPLGSRLRSARRGGGRPLSENQELEASHVEGADRLEKEA